MQTEQLDSFIELLYSVEESATTLTSDQVQKLQLIQSKVSDLVAKVGQAATIPVQQPVQQLVPVSEKRVHDFKTFSKKTY
jgi:hypothetical protein